MRVDLSQKAEQQLDQLRVFFRGGRRAQLTCEDEAVQKHCFCTEIAPSESTLHRDDVFTEDAACNMRKICPDIDESRMPP